MALTLQKYLTRLIVKSVAFIMTLGICLALWGFRVIDIGAALGIGAGLGGVFILVPAVIDLVKLISYNKRAEKAKPEIMTVSGWHNGFFKSSASVFVNIGNKECKSPSFFYSDEAAALVGKQVLASNIDGTLFIYEIKK